MINLLKIKATRKFLTKEACAKLTISLVTSHLDYANGLLVGLPQGTRSTPESPKYSD